ncbi:DNA repair protein RecO [Candidatus Falkowbacteria bacterium HGW-Falkowbacteria-1]|jgi:DNA repair protein RecO (recombination protein O)|uniref:DNA repair protein RecO n=1 Tax=Candidatus Falkowbacteria bacterium HGW-Falkowbacteria-1 TaxID=2013768 RepID=A0A2N2E9A3_9BACT|nr:MAG: DNA repair protein RecO [Candidatus Falkowbacteria bacterium HGW-Falkowbacteria-1]
MIRTRAIVLNRVDFRESDSLVSFYTLDFGKITLVARGTKKQASKLVAHLEPFNFVDLMMIKNKNGNSVGSVISKNSFLNIKSDLNSIYISGKLFHFFNNLSREGQQDFDLFFFLNDFLKSINGNGHKIEKFGGDHLDFLVDVFKFKLLSILGYSFHINSCVECGKDKHLDFLNFLKGGVICQACYDKDLLTNGFKKNDYIGLSKELLSAKKALVSSDFDSILDIQLDKSLHNLIKKKILFLNI